MRGCAASSAHIVQIQPRKHALGCAEEVPEVTRQHELLWIIPGIWQIIQHREYTYSRSASEDLDHDAGVDDSPRDAESCDVPYLVVGFPAQMTARSTKPILSQLISPPAPSPAALAASTTSGVPPLSARTFCSSGVLSQDFDAF